jgi:ribose 5-phosphate isomerase A
MPMEQNEKKLAAARAALEYVPPGTTLGVGTGSTVNHLIGLLPAIRERIDRVVSSSRATTRLLADQGFDAITLNEAGGIDVYIDGADEATKRLHLVKGGGGALTREKVLAAAARRFVCVVDDSKLVGMLGTYPLPIEVLPMAQEFVAGRLVKLRGRPVWRDDFVTDNGNHILDVHGLQISNPVEMETRLNQIPGIVTVGIFANRPADILLVAGDEGVRELRA